jgi:nitrate/nitrite-specific signal transduction histidine kinase
VLTERGLAAALDAVVQRSPLPVELSVAVSERLDAAIEAAAYFLVSEALTNAAKHAEAESVSVDVAEADGTLVVTIADDGKGGADAQAAVEKAAHRRRFSVHEDFGRRAAPFAGCRQFTAIIVGETAAGMHFG